MSTPNDAVKFLLRVGWLIYALLTLTGILEIDGSFHAMRAWTGVLGFVLMGFEVYVVFIPIRLNRTYYSIRMSKTH